MPQSGLLEEEEEEEARGVDGSLHLKVSSMNRLNQPEPATFSIFAVLGFL
jgi:hypothetical protein